MRRRERFAQPWQTVILCRGFRVEMFVDEKADLAPYVERYLRRIVVTTTYLNVIDNGLPSRRPGGCVHSLREGAFDEKSTTPAEACATLSRWSWPSSLHRVRSVRSRRWAVLLDPFGVAPNGCHVRHTIATNGP